MQRSLALTAVVCARTARALLQRPAPLRPSVRMASTTLYDIMTDARLTKSERASEVSE